MIANGHSPDHAWSYTPRKIKSYAWLANRRINQKAALNLAIGALAANGDSKQIREQQKRLMDD